MVKESLNRASPSSTECSRELLKFSPQMIHFILGTGHHLRRPGLFSVTLDLSRTRSAHSLQNFGMCTFGKVESSYGIWLLQGARGPSETLLVFPREKGNGLDLSKLSPIARPDPRPPPWWFTCSQGPGPGFLQYESGRKWIAPLPLAVGEVDRDA